MGERFTDYSRPFRPDIVLCIPKIDKGKWIRLGRSCRKLKPLTPLLPRTNAVSIDCTRL